MEWVETTGRTVEEAKKSALEQLGVEEADTDFQVISEPKVGLFGRLKEEARVRAECGLATRAQKVKGASGGGAAGLSGADHGSQAAPPRASGSVDQRGKRWEGGTNTRAGRGRTGRSPGSGGSRVAGRRRRRSPSSAPVTNPNEEALTSAKWGRRRSKSRLRWGSSSCKGCWPRWAPKQRSASEELAEGVVELLIDRREPWHVHRPKGATLLALQELTRTVMQHQVSSSECRVVLDINGYRRRRQDALARFARQVALEVQASNTKRALEPMPPPDRKVVHDAVNDIPGVIDGLRRRGALPASRADP